MRGPLTALAVRLGVLAVLWAALLEGDPLGLLLGVLVLPPIAWGSLALDPPGGARVCPLALVCFLPFCGGMALAGALDAVRRALHRGPPPLVGRLVLSSRLPRGPARLLLNSVVSLVPGTFSVETERDTLTLHLLDAGDEARGAARARVRELEERVARVFGLLPPPRGLS